MQILNLDPFTTVTRKVTINGVSHAVEELSVQQYIDNMSAAEALEKSGAKVGAVASFEDAITSISQSIPTLSKEAIGKLKIPAMTAILDFIRGETPQQVASASDAEGESEKKPS